MLKRYIIGTISEKGGVGKTTIITALVKLLKKPKHTIFINLDDSSYSAFYTLNDARLNNIEYCDYNYKGLDQLLSSNLIKQKYIFIDFKGEQVSLDIIKKINSYISWWLIPIVPSKTNFGAFTHILENFNKLNTNNILVIFNLLNNLLIEDVLVKEFEKEIQQFTNIELFTYPISYYKNIDQPNKTLINHRNNKFILQELISRIINEI